MDLDPNFKDRPLLVVDDYSLTREMVRSILRQLGFTNVFAVEDGRKALEKIRIEEFGLIICDWNMPNMNGIELLREVRKEPRFKDLPFLMLTAEAQKENVIEAMKAGVSDYMIKPFTAALLIEKIESIYKKTLTGMI